jgi:hypothetical protein
MAAGRHRSRQGRISAGRAREACADALAQPSPAVRRRFRYRQVLAILLMAWWAGITAARGTGLLPMDWRTSLAYVAGFLGFGSAWILHRQHQRKIWRQTAGRAWNQPASGLTLLRASSAQRIDGCEERLDDHGTRLAAMEDGLAAAWRASGRRPVQAPARLRLVFNREDAS